MRVVLALGGLGLIVSSAALAQDPNAKPAKKSDLDKIVCKTEDFVGSMIPRRICMKKSEWDQARQNGQEMMGKTQQIQVDKNFGSGG